MKSASYGLLDYTRETKMIRGFGQMQGGKEAFWRLLSPSDQDSIWDWAKQGACAVGCADDISFISMGCKDTLEFVWFL